jgi:hypothetical protein
MDIQTGQGRNVDLAVERCADAAKNIISRSDYVHIKSNSSVNGIASSGIMCRMLIRLKKGFHVSWGLNDLHALILSTNLNSLTLEFPDNLPLSASVYYMVKAIDKRNLDLAGLAVTACFYESAFDVGERIIKESRNSGIVDELKGAKFYFEDVKESILYLTEPILDISGDAEGVDHFLKALDISGDVKSLDKSKMSRLISLLILKSIDQDEKQLVDNVIVLNNELISTVHRFMATIEVSIDAPGLVLSLCLKDDKALHDAKTRLINNRLQRIEELQSHKDKKLKK